MLDVTCVTWTGVIVCSTVQVVKNIFFYIYYTQKVVLTPLVIKRFIYLFFVFFILIQNFIQHKKTYILRQAQTSTQHNTGVLTNDYLQKLKHACIKRTSIKILTEVVPFVRCSEKRCQHTKQLWNKWSRFIAEC